MKILSYIIITIDLAFFFIKIFLSGLKLMISIINGNIHKKNVSIWSYICDYLNKLFNNCVNLFSFVIINLPNIVSFELCPGTACARTYIHIFMYIYAYIFMCIYIDKCSKIQKLGYK